MASSSSLLSEELFHCSVCLDVFTDPVSIPCGHSFCRACLGGLWAASGTCHCPKCSRGFAEMPELCPNTFAKEMAEQIQQRRHDTSRCRLVGPGEVGCDMCPSREVCLAVKSCLVCLLSYCEKHLAAHSVRFTKHPLVEALGGLERRMCGKHERPLELFCRYDQTCVCVLCTDAEHSAHHTVPVEREWAEKKTHLVQMQDNVRQMINIRLMKVNDIKQSVGISRKNTDEEMAESVKVFTALLHSIEKSRQEVLQVLGETQKAAERKAEELVTELEQEIFELRRREAKLEQLSHMSDHLYLLQMFPSLRPPLSPKDWSQISVPTTLCVDRMREALSKLQEQLRTHVAHFSEKELERISKYAVDVTLDPDTANPWLVVTVDGKQVRDGEMEQDLPDSPQRFDTAPCILATEPISCGRSYWVVEVANKTAWDLGVAKESIKSKGRVTLSPEDGYWAICLRKGNEYRACAKHSVLLSLPTMPQMVGVFVDIDKGCVSFYDVGGRSHMYSFTGYKFTERLLPFFNPEMVDSGNNKAPLVILPIDLANGGDTYDGVTI